MSQYEVTVEAASYAACKDAARIMYDYTPYPKMFFTWEEYAELVVNDAGGLPSILCRFDGELVGALTIGDVVRDSSISGTGVVVYNAVVHPGHPTATRLMYRFLVNRLREVGAQWYHTTARLSATEYRSKFRRVHG